MKTDKPSIGRIVHFVCDKVHYAAVITKVWNDTSVNLYVFPTYGYPIIVPGALNSDRCASSVPYSEPRDCCGVAQNWSWHWPEVVS